MNTIAKLIACFSAIYVFSGCQQTTTPTVKLSPFEQEIQKMLAGEEGAEQILREFLQGKERGASKEILDLSVNTFEAQNGFRPENANIIQVLSKINLLHSEQRNAAKLDSIKQKLSDQYDREIGR